MSVFGIIYVAYNTADLLPLSLPPWIAARRGGLGGHTFKVVAVCCPFEGFPQPEQGDDSTLAQLQTHLASGLIDHVITSPVPITEVSARGAALRWLVAQGADYLWQVDSDEQIEEKDILSVARFVESQPYVHCFRLPYRNLVFDDRHYLAEPFTPMRIHRVRAPARYTAADFWDDNNVRYTRRPWECIASDISIRDVEMSCLTIPTSVAWPLHHTWLNDERSRRKQEYQRKRWGHCSFRWRGQRDLCFDESYFAARGEPLPEVLSLDNAP